MEGWLALECFRRGTSPDHQNNPPTIVLSVPLDSPRTWKVERDQITALLDDEGLQEVAVEVVRSYIWKTTDMDGHHKHCPPGYLMLGSKKHNWG